MSFLNRFWIWRVEGYLIFQQGKIPWKADIAGGRGGGEVKGTSFNQIQLSVKKCLVGKYSTNLFQALFLNLRPCTFVKSLHSLLPV